MKFEYMNSMPVAGDWNKLDQCFKEYNLRNKNDLADNLPNFSHNLWIFKRGFILFYFLFLLLFLFYFIFYFLFSFLFLLFFLFLFFNVFIYF